MVDADNDGRKDLLTGAAEGNIMLYMNTNTDDAPAFDGGAALTVGEPGFKTAIDVGQRATPTVVDWNNNGRRDIVVGARDGYIRLFINEGTDASWDFRTQQFVLEDGAPLLVPTLRASPEVLDIDGDEKKDLLVGNTEGQLLQYLNTGTDETPSFSGYTLIEAGDAVIDLSGTPRSRPFVCDWTGDGAKDVLVGSGDGLVRLYQGTCQGCPSAGELPQAGLLVRMLAPYPNPFNPVVTIPFELSLSGLVQIAVYDAAGRRAAVIADGIYPEGFHRAVWRGAGKDGRALPSGTYFVRLRTGEETARGKVILLR